MSIPVDVNELSHALADFDAGYLLTVAADARVKAVSVVPVLVGGTLRIAAPGRGSSANVTAHDQVTVLYPPREPGGVTLLVDGTAQPAGPDDQDVWVTPTSAVLHRSAAS